LDPLILIDQSEKINYVNPAASRLTGFRADELVGREIKFIIPSFVGEAEIITELLGKSRRPTGVNLQAFPISGQRGWVLLARDLTEVLRLRKSIQKLNSELNLAVERARKINKFLMSFSGMIEPAKLAILLRDMQTDDFEIATTFKGMDELLGEYSKLYAEKNQLQDESDAKVREIDYLTDVTREQKDLLQKLQTEYEKLTR
jgi:hypothetical protein